MVGTKEMLEKLEEMENDVKLWEYNGGKVTKEMSDLVALFKRMRKYLKSDNKSGSELVALMDEHSTIVANIIVPLT